MKCSILFCKHRSNGAAHYNGVYITIIEIPIKKPYNTSFLCLDPPFGFYVGKCKWAFHTEQCSHTQIKTNTLRKTMEINTTIL